MAIAQRLKRLEKDRDDFTFAADMSGAAMKNKRVAGNAKLQGMRCGETDLRLFFSDARFLQVELKTADGVVSAGQKARHALLRKMDLDHGKDSVHAFTQAQSPHSPKTANFILLRKPLFVQHKTSSTRSTACVLRYTITHERFIAAEFCDMFVPVL